MDFEDLNEFPFAGIKTWDRISAYLDVRPNRKKRGKMLHASRILSLCPILEYWKRKWEEKRRKARGKKKKEYAALLHEAKYAHKFHSGLQAILDTGTVLHLQVQYYYGVVGLLVGSWKCPECGHVVTGENGEPIKMPRIGVAGSKRHKIFDFDLCPNCRSNDKSFPHWLYVEPHAANKTEGIEGSTDGFLDYKFDGTIYKGILEVKSINENGFLEKYGEPLPTKKHVFQASIYMHLFGRSWALILYFNKNKSVVKEFIVKKNPDAWPQAVEKSRAIRRAVKAGKPPKDDWRTCSSIRDKTARACPAIELCWGAKAPENFMAE